ALVMRLLAADVVAQVQQFVGRLDPCPGRDVAVALRCGRQVVGMERCVILGPLVVAEVWLTSRGRSTPGDGAARSRWWCRCRGRASRSCPQAARRTGGPRWTG